MHGYSAMSPAARYISNEISGEPPSGMRAHIPHLGKVIISKIYMPFHFKFHLLLMAIDHKVNIIFVKQI